MPILPSTTFPDRSLSCLSLIKKFSIKEVFLSEWKPESFHELPPLLQKNELSAIESLAYTDYMNNTHDLGEGGAYFFSQAFRISSPCSSLLNIMNLSINSFLGEKGGKLIISIVPHLPNLQTLCIQRSGMGPLVVAEMAKSFNSWPCRLKLRTLNLYGSHPGDIGAYFLSEHLKELPQLATLDLSEVFKQGPHGESKRIQKLGRNLLIDACGKHPSITVLNLSGHAFRRSLDKLHIDLKNENGQPVEVCF
jgi:hypothetical protein